MLLLVFGELNCRMKVFNAHITSLGRASKAAMSASHVAPIGNLYVETHIAKEHHTDKHTKVNRFLKLFLSTEVDGPITTHWQDRISTGQYTLRSSVFGFGESGRI
jgi:hypothetical protein